MLLDRQRLVACLMMPLLGCAAGAEDSHAHQRACSVDDDLDGAPISILDGPVEIGVCGDGRLVTIDGATTRAVLEWSDFETIETEFGALLGVSADAPELGPLVVPAGVVGEPTRNVYLSMNLNPGYPTAGPFDPRDPFTTCDYLTSMTVYGEEGMRMEVLVAFENRGGAQWAMYALSECEEYVPSLLGEATLQFSTNGELESVEGGTFLSPCSDNPDATWQVHLMGPGARTTSLAASSAVDAVENDGSESSALVGLVVTRRGEVLASYADSVEPRSLGWVLDGIEGWLVPLRGG